MDALACDCCGKRAVCFRNVCDPDGIRIDIPFCDDCLAAMEERVGIWDETKYGEERSYEQ